MGRKLIAVVAPLALAGLIYLSTEADRPAQELKSPPAPTSAERSPTDGELLVRSLRQAEATNADPLEVRRQLQQVLSRRPDLADAAAAGFSELESAEILFQVGRMLGGHVQRPAVRRALLGALESPDAPAGRRAAAAYGLNGLRDAEAARRLAATFLDEGAPDSVRTAAAFSLTPALESLEEADRAAVRARSREILTNSEISTELRVEAVDLVDPTAAGAQLQQQLNKNADPRMALAAARRLLGAGVEPGPVLERLEELVRRPDISPALARSLKAVLDEVPAAYKSNEGMEP